MSLEIYTDGYANRKELTHAISVQMTYYYNEIGKLTIVADADDYNIAALVDGNMLYDTDRGITYDICNVKCDTKQNRITANGYTTTKRLNRRCIASEFTLRNLEAGVYSLINANLRNLTRINTAQLQGLEESTDAILFGGQILDTVIPYLEEAGLGHKTTWDPDGMTLRFQIYKGADRTEGIHAVVFSEEQGSAQDLIINDDSSTLATVIYVPVEYSDKSSEVIEVDGFSGNERIEYWMPSVITQASDEEVEATRERARQAALVELAKRIRRKSFTVTIDGSDLSTAYNVGDIVSCVSLRFNASFNARITGVKYAMDINGATTSVILGDPILTALGELKLNG